MNNAQQIEALADNKIAEADSMYAIGLFDAAYYNAGYAVELYLKARICITLQIDDFFDFGNREKFMYEDSITKPYKVHNFVQLLILSGLAKEHAKEMKNATFDKAWSKLKIWKEDVRYSIGKEQEEVNDFIDSIKIFQKWIKKHL